MKIKNLKKCLAGTLSFLMVSSITMLPASALSYPTDLSMAQLNFSVSNTVSAPKNNLSAMYNSRASGMASSAVKTNAGYENQGGTPSAYGKTAQDVYNEVGNKDFISNSGWQSWGSQNASNMPDYNSLVSSNQTAAEDFYNSAVSEMPETATNAMNMGLSDLLSNNAVAKTVYDNALNDYAATTILKVKQDAYAEAEGTTQSAITDAWAAERKINEVESLFDSFSSDSLLSSIDELGNLNIVDYNATNTPFSLFVLSNETDTQTFGITYDQTENSPKTIAEQMGITIKPIETSEIYSNDTDLLSNKDKKKLEIAGISENSPYYSKEFVDSLDSQEINALLNGKEITDIQNNDFQPSVGLQIATKQNAISDTVNASVEAPTFENIFNRMFPSPTEFYAP